MALRESQSYEAFERRWQLPVYFQLRWKEIVTSFETSLGSPTTASGEWALSQSAAAWKAFSTCWDSEVFIPDLANRFWRLSLQISVRYGAWLRSQLKEGEEDPVIEEQSLRTAASALLDIELFERKVREIEMIKENKLDGERFSE
jgi:hypothetical protein